MPQPLHTSRFAWWNLLPAPLDRMGHPWQQLTLHRHTSLRLPLLKGNSKDVGTEGLGYSWAGFLPRLPQYLVKLNSYIKEGLWRKEDHLFYLTTVTFLLPSGPMKPTHGPFPHPTPLISLYYTLLKMGCCYNYSSTMDHFWDMSVK